MKMPIVAARIWKTGGGYVITVPKEYVRNGIVSLSKRYSVVLQEEEKDVPKKASNRRFPDAGVASPAIMGFDRNLYNSGLIGTF